MDEEDVDAATRAPAALAVANGKIYVMGGFVPPKDTAVPVGGAWEPIDSAWEYDPAVDSWKSLPPLPGKRGSAIAAEVGGKIYVIGGRTGHGFILAATNTDVVEEYNPINDSWIVPKERMPTARSGGASGSDGRRIYVAGGDVTTKDLVGAFRSVEAYDRVTNSWLTLPSMTMPRHGIAGAVINNRFHLVSGMMQSAGALVFLDPTLSTHTAMHDILEIARSARAASGARCRPRGHGLRPHAVQVAV